MHRKSPRRTKAPTGRHGPTRSVGAACAGRSCPPTTPAPTAGSTPSGIPGGVPPPSLGTTERDPRSELDISPERVAGVRVAAVEAGREPLHPLPRRPMGPRFRVRGPGGLLLDPVVADGCRGVEPLLQVAGFEQLPPLGGVTPHPGQTIRLELQADRERVGPIGVLLGLLVDGVAHPEQVLHVVTDL